MSPAPYSFQPYEKVPENRTPNKTEYTVWNYLKLIGYLGKLVEDAGGGKDGPIGAFDEADDEFRPHDVTYLKLLLLWSYTLRFQEYGKAASSWYYIDLLSASGLNYAKSDPKDPIPGSCFIVPLADQRFAQPETDLRHKFERVYCLDKNPDALKAIELRREGLESKFGLDLPDYSYYAGDANESIIGVLDDIQELANQRRAGFGPLGLVFVDNLGLDITLETIGQIQKRCRADLVVHLPTRAIWRCIEASKSGNNQNKLTAFFGGDSWRKISSKDQIPGVYHEVVQAATGHEFQDFSPVPIKGTASDFHLCIYVRHTKGTKNKSGWVGIIEKLAQECGRIDNAKIRSVRDIATGKARTLFDF